MVEEVAYMEKLTPTLLGKHICKRKDKFMINLLSGFGPVTACENNVINFWCSTEGNLLARRTAIKWSRKP
jgi:hypothetical protein